MPAAVLAAARTEREQELRTAALAALQRDEASGSDSEGPLTLSASGALARGTVACAVPRARLPRLCDLCYNLTFSAFSLSGEEANRSADLWLAGCPGTTPSGVCRRQPATLLRPAPAVRQSSSSWSRTECAGAAARSAAPASKAAARALVEAARSRSPTTTAVVAAARGRFAISSIHADGSIKSHSSTAASDASQRRSLDC